MFKKGYTPWNKGKECPQLAYWKGKSSPMKGKHAIAWNKGLTKKEDARLDYVRPTAFKIGERRLLKFGKDNPGYKGGKTPEITRLRNTKEYKSWRKEVFEKDNYTCIWCGQIGGILNADHIKTFAHYPELRFQVSNGRTLCLECHKKTPTFGWKSAKIITITQSNP